MFERYAIVFEQMVKGAFEQLETRLCDSDVVEKRELSSGGYRDN
tara:strand:- start:894 stop:1025 length:132 start_codon:yes stop_codon:yes gene_type:complete